ncbi:unnamed protein product [Discosporangium mesarthrocarpum]
MGQRNQLRRIHRKLKQCSTRATRVAETDSRKREPGKRGQNANRCEYGLKRYHRRRECTSYRAGRPPAERPAGMAPARPFPTPEHRRTDDTPHLTFIAAQEETIQNLEEVAILTTQDNKIKMLSDSGANEHITPYLEDLTNPKETTRTCTFGNKDKLAALAEGDLSLQIKQANGAVHITLNVLFIPEVPFRLLSTGALRRTGGEFHDSEIDSYLRTGRGGPKINLQADGTFLVLQGNSVPKQGLVHATLASKPQHVPLEDWYNILGHMNPEAIKHLGRQGLP